MKNSHFLFWAFAAAAVMVITACGGKSSADSPAAPSGESSPAASVVGSPEWDRILNEYEQVVNEYVELMNKAKAGNFLALANTGDLDERAENLANRLENASDSLSPQQAARLLELHKRLTDAAASLLQQR
jgi:hypothetical protein